VRPTSKQAYARLMVLKYVVAHSISTPSKPVLSQVFEKWSEAERREFDSRCQARAEANVAKMHELRLWKHASPKEQLFLQSFGSQMDAHIHEAAAWRMECAGMIMWALGLIDRWPKIDAETSPDLLKSILVKKVRFLSKHPKLRPPQEMCSKRDLMEFWHWRVVTRRLIEEKAPFEPDENMKRAGLNTLDEIVRFAAKSGHERGDLEETLDEDFVFRGKPFRDLSGEEYRIAASIITERHYAFDWLCGMAPGNRWDETPTHTRWSY